MIERAYIIYPVTLNGTAGWAKRINLEFAPEEEAELDVEVAALTPDFVNQLREDIEAEVNRRLDAPPFSTREEALESAIPLAAIDSLPIEIHDEEGEVAGTIPAEECRRAYGVMIERGKEPELRTHLSFVEQ